VPPVADGALTPELALAYLGELSTDIRMAAVLGADGSLLAHSGVDEDESERLRTLVGELWERVDAAAGDGRPPAQVEVTLPEGIVFALRDAERSLAVVAGRYALSSLMFYDLRMVARDLAGANA
jgi:hypothetical protein